MSDKPDFKDWNPDREIVEALEDAISRISAEERNRKVGILGVRGKTFTLEELAEIYRKGEPIEVAKSLKKTLIFNTVQRLKK